MKSSIKALQATMLLLCLLSLAGSLTACAHGRPEVVIVPDSRELIDLSKGSPPRPEWVGISKGYLLEIFKELQNCHGGQGK
ncbi:MAG: hypothetical protein HZA22_04695 [Nitrospirae bacterium]|nr:hypothetical protein [Nitrospirota bacterium]